MKKNTITKILLAFFSSTLVLSKVFAATYYVATTGNDSRTTTQAQVISTPWKTIQKAANTLVAGDIVYILGGTYKERVTPKYSGSSAAGYITYTNYAGQKVTLDGTQGCSVKNSFIVVYPIKFE